MTLCPVCKFISLCFFLVNLMLYSKDIRSMKFLIIDSNSVIHRAFHALPPLTNSKGDIINAAYGFFSVLIKITREVCPDCVIAAFDLPEPTFRHKEFKEYKAKRPPTPGDLTSQFSIIKNGLKSLGITVLEKKGFEADDIIGTVAKIVSRESIGSSVILSGDKDNLQLIGPSTEVLLLKKGIKDIVAHDMDRIKKDYEGLNPRQLIEIKSLQGDQSDNIPGVSGIGEKTALDLIGRFGSLEKVYEEIDRGSDKISSIVTSKLLNNRDNAFMSRNLVTIRTDVDLGDFNLEACRWSGFAGPETLAYFQKMEFNALIKRIKEDNGDFEKKNLSLF